MKWIWWPSLWILISFLPEPLLSFPDGLMNKVVMVARREVIHGLNSMDFYSPRPIWLLPLQSAQSAKNRDQHWPQYGTVPQDHWTATSWQIDNIGLLIIMERIAFCSHWKPHFCGYGFAFFAWNASSKTTIRGFTKCLIHRIVFHTALLLIKELTSLQIKCNSRSYVRGIHRAYHVPHHPEAADLTE